MVLALNMPPSPTLLNQCLAIACWGVAVALIGQLPSNGSAPALLVRAWPAVAAIGLLVLAGHRLGGARRLAGVAGVVDLAVTGRCTGRAVRGPAGVSHPTATHRDLVLRRRVVRGAGQRRDRRRPGLLAGGAGWRLDRPLQRGRARGRQPASAQSPEQPAAVVPRRCRGVGGDGSDEAASGMVAAGALLLGATVLTGSRTGIVGVLLLCVWGLVDRRLTRSTRRALAITPLLYGLIWCALTIWAHLTGHLFGGETRLIAVASGSDISSSRLAIWLNTLELIADQPLARRGLRRVQRRLDADASFRLARRRSSTTPTTCRCSCWSSSAFRWDRGGALLLSPSRWRGAWRCAARMRRRGRCRPPRRLHDGADDRPAQPARVPAVVLATSCCRPPSRAGLRLASGSATSNRRSGPPRQARLDWSSGGARSRRGLAVRSCSEPLAAALDYRTSPPIYDPPEHAAPLEERIAAGQRSPIFGHHADYAAATAFGRPKAPCRRRKSSRSSARRTTCSTRG